MTTTTDPNKRTPSTTWEWRKVRMRPPAPQAMKTAAKPSSPALAPRNMRERLTIDVVHRGGAESWWELRARGRVWRRPGHLALDDVMREIFGGTGGKIPER